MFRFANPEYLYLLLLIPILIVFFVVVRMLRKRDIEKFGNPELLKQLMPLVSIYRAHVKFYLLLAAIAIVVFLLARPQTGAKLETIRHQGIEVMIALDVSNSMLAEDVLPNRLGRSKQIASRLIDALENDRVGLVVFAGDAFVQLPITADNVSARMFMSAISPDMIAHQGTAIGAAIDLSARSFRQTEGVGRAIILITDCENHEDDAIAAARQAAERGITVHVIGVGSPSGSPIPIPGTPGFRRDRNGNIVITQLNEQMCRGIAEAGNGIYVHADNTNFAIRTIVEELRLMSSTEMETTRVAQYNELFLYIAWIVLLLLLLEFFISNRKNKLFLNFSLFDDKKTKQ